MAAESDVFGLISQIISSAPSSFQMFFGGSQMNEAKKLEKQTVRPLAEIAPSVDRLTNYLYGKTMARDIPGGEIARNEIKGATAAGMRAASELGSGAEAYGALRQMALGEQNMFSQLAKDTLKQQMDYDEMYKNALLTKADEENRVWTMNKWQPYLESVDRINWLRSSGMQNQFSGASGLADTASQYVNTLGVSSSNGGGDGQLSDERFNELVNAIKG